VLIPGSTIGDVSQPSRCYRIVRAVGRGGMGEVYEAVQVQLARRVALKTIRAAQKEVEVGDGEIIGRLCRPGGSRAGAGQTVP
jgi:serine/threonine protein kinase